MNSMNSIKELGKKSAANKAAEFVESGMIVGLGSGSTVYYAVIRLGELVRDGLDITCISTSSVTTALARECGIKLIRLEDTNTIDLTIDGADEIDSHLNGIKGGGGALLFEKIVALYSEKNIWIADSSKLVETLGKFPLPLEVIPFGHERVLRILDEMKLNPAVRMKDGQVFKTDSGNITIDLSAGDIKDPQLLDRELKLITGVVETGIFCGIADLAVLAEGENIRILDKT